MSLPQKSEGQIKPSSDNSPASRIGWNQSAGPPLPSYCPSCKAIFSSQIYQFAGAFWSLWDNEEPCPKCNYKHAKLSEGIFDFTNDAINILSAPDITYTMLVALQNTLAEHKSERINSLGAQEEILRQLPLLKRIFNRKNIDTGLLLLMLIVPSLIAYRSAELQKGQLIEAQNANGIANAQLKQAETANKLTEKQVEQSVLANDILQKQLQNELNTDEILNDVLSRLRQLETPKFNGQENLTTLKR